MDQTFVNQFILNAIIVALIQYIKKSKWIPWLTVETENLNRTIAIVLSGLASLGVHTSFDHTAGVLTITGLTLATLWSGLYNWIVSFVTQQAIFKATVDKYPAISGEVIKGTTAFDFAEIARQIKKAYDVQVQADLAAKSTDDKK